MCLAVIAAAQSERYPWVLASNRDEFFGRPALPLAWWQPDPGGPAILSGRDLLAGGTWLGAGATGRLALVTNVREPGRTVAGARSRGALVPQWLLGTDGDALREMAGVPRNGYNFVAADLRRDTGLWFSNRAAGPLALGPGLHGVSNALLDTPWPKVLQLKQRLAAAVSAAPSVTALCASAFEALADPRPAPDDRLPATGVPLERERRLSPAFIRIDDAAGAYGTRCSTLVVVERTRRGRVVTMIERRYDEDGRTGGQTGFEFALPSA